MFLYLDTSKMYLILFFQCCWGFFPSLFFWGEGIKNIKVSRICLFTEYMSYVKNHEYTIRMSCMTIYFDFKLGWFNNSVLHTCMLNHGN